MTHTEILRLRFRQRRLGEPLTPVAAIVTMPRPLPDTSRSVHKIPPGFRDPGRKRSGHPGTDSRSRPATGVGGDGALRNGEEARRDAPPDSPAAFRRRVRAYVRMGLLAPTAERHRRRDACAACDLRRESGHHGLWLCSDRGCQSCGTQYDLRMVLLSSRCPRSQWTS
jgi:hypothetical protein